MTIQDGNTIKSSTLREDYGAFATDAPAPASAKIREHASRVTTNDFAVFDLSVSSGKGYSPNTRFLWKPQDGQAFLENSYIMKPAEGKGSSSASTIELSVRVK